MKKSTIVAISTPIGVGGISIVRLSGKDALKIVSKVFSCKKANVIDFKPRYFYLGEFKAESFNEKCMVVYFKAPHSYTGEDLIEIQCHGGVAITKGILSTLLNNGARLATGGEFTKRAFLNGKISLDEAEGVIDIINAESDSEIKAGYSLLDGRLHKEINAIQKLVTNMIASIEVTFDYPEHDIEEQTSVQVNKQLLTIKNRLNNLLNTSNTGMTIKNGCRVLILGKPNVGKSSIMNALLNYDRAIVTSIQGTTRDILEETYIYNGVKFIITDTAGVRESDDIVEKIGIEKARNAVNYADIILVVLDGSENINNLDSDILSLVKNKKHIVVVNKCDLSLKLDKNKFNDINTVFVSALNKNGIETIKQKIYNEVIDSKIISSNIMITNMRHVTSLQKALDLINVALLSIKNRNSLELVSIDIYNIWLALGEITGENNNEEIIDKIFANFCVGK